MKTQQARVAFAEHITGFWKAGAEYGKPHGLAALLVPVDFLTTLRPSGRLSLLVHPTAAPAFQALASVLLFHDYAIREWASGTLAWRNITGASRARIDEQVRTQRPLATSLHAHGVAVDLNPSVNPYGSTRTDMSAEMVTHALGIRTAAGARGGDPGRAGGGDRIADRPRLVAVPILGGRAGGRVDAAQGRQERAGGVLPGGAERLAEPSLPAPGRGRRD